MNKNILIFRQFTLRSRLDYYASSSFRPRCSARIPWDMSCPHPRAWNSSSSARISAPSAFLTSTWTPAGAVTGALLQRHGRDDEQVAELIIVSLQNRVSGVGRGEDDLRLQALPISLLFRASSSFSELLRELSGAWSIPVRTLLLLRMMPRYSNRRAMSTAEGNCARCTLSGRPAVFGK